MGTNRERILHVLTMVQNDLEADTHRWEGAELNGRNVAEMMGELRGTVHGLAGAGGGGAMTDEQWPRGRAPSHDITPLDPKPWTDGEQRRKHWFGAYLPTGQLSATFEPREGYCHNPDHYPLTDKEKEKIHD